MEVICRSYTSQRDWIRDKNVLLTRLGQISSLKWVPCMVWLTDLTLWGCWEDSPPRCPTTAWRPSLPQSSLASSSWRLPRRHCWSSSLQSWQGRTVLDYWLLSYSSSIIFPPLLSLPRRGTAEVAPSKSDAFSSLYWELSIEVAVRRENWNQ